MASDEITWNIINNQHCSYKLKLDNRTQNFCRNEYNATGFCNRQSCPLANSRYATVRPDPSTGTLCLYIKTPERVHLPSQWWERVQLPANYEKALALIDERLIYWPKFNIHKCKQRLTRLTQVSIRERRIAKEELRLGETIVPRIAPKIRRREDTRERKAESAAKVERAIERELIDRLRSGAYGDRPINVEEGVWKKVLRGLERAEGHEIEEEEEEQEKEVDVEYVEGLEESDAEEMEDFDDWFDGESVDESGSEDVSDGEDDSNDDGSDESSEPEQDETKPATGAKRKRPAPQQKPRKKGAKMEIEYEMEPPLREAQLAY